MLKLVPVVASIILAAVWHTAIAGVIMLATLFSMALLAMYQGTKETS